MSVADVSVLTPSLGYARFIPDALQSVAIQQGVTVQHVVQDGGSTDGTLDVLRAADVDWRCEPDEGQSDALNRALARAEGTWVCWLNADEFYLPGSLAHLIDIAEREQADVVYGDAVFVDAAGRIDRLLAQHRFDRTILFHYGTIIPSCAVLIRRSLLTPSIWDTSLRLLMDRELYMHLVRDGAKVVHTRRPIGAFRVHEERVSAASSAAFQNDYTTIGERYGPTSRPRKLWARYKRPVLKLLDGSYGRERKIAGLKGRDIRWFASEEGREGCRMLFERYGVPAPAPSAER